MKFFDIFRKKKSKTPTNSTPTNTNHVNNSDCTYANNNFLINYNNEIRHYEKSIVDIASSILDTDDYNIQVDKLNKLISTFNNFKTFCNSKDGGASYFSSMWLHCHNSQNNDFSYITRYEDKLNYLLNNKIEAEEKIELEKNRVNFEKNAEKELLKFLSNNNEILQKDIYKYYPKEYKQIIQSTLYFMAKNNKISREKQGNTYKIFIKK